MVQCLMHTLTSKLTIYQLMLHISKKKTFYFQIESIEGDTPQKTKILLTNPKDFALCSLIE